MRIRIRPWLVAAALAAGALAHDVAPARAQIAEAIGKPLPKSDVSVGTLRVLIVQGEVDKPVVGVDVRLTVDGESDPRIARTDASGHAQFPNLKPGTKVKAATDGASGEVASDEFEMPGDSGVAVLLSTVPWNPNAGGGAPFAGGRPAPRMMAGQPRPEPTDPSGRITVRVTYNDLDSTKDVDGKPVTMVAYAADGRVAAKVVSTDKDGRAVFDSLDTTGATAYYALTMLPRNGHMDRLSTLPMVPGADMGIRVMLSAEKQDSKEPTVDDLSKFAREPDMPLGKLVVIFGGTTPDTGTVTVRDAVTGKEVGHADVRPGRPLDSSITGSVGDATPDKSVAAGTVAVNVVVSADNQQLGLPQAPVRLRTPPGADGQTPAGGFDHASTTDKDGNVSFTDVPVGVPLQLVSDIQGKTYTGNTFTLPADQGVKIGVTSSFELLSLAEADFDSVAATPESALYAEITVKGETYRSPPFQMAPERGVVVPIFVIEQRISFTFSIDSFLDDDYLAVRGQFALQNASFSPWAGPSEGVRVPAVDGATGLVVADESKPFVAVDGNSFRLLRPVPPMGGDFTGGFSLPVDDGEVHWDLPLPMGAKDASLAIRETPGMKVELGAAGAQGKPVKDPQSGYTWYAIQNIGIAANQRMVFDIRGLPSRPPWQHWARLIVGLSVILLLSLGVVFAFAQRQAAIVAAGPTPKKQRRKRIEDLLDQVAANDRAAARGGGDAKRREAMVHELERLYGEEG